jgi:hypothetical protein
MKDFFKINCHPEFISEPAPIFVRGSKIIAINQMLEAETSSA